MKKIIIIGFLLLVAVLGYFLVIKNKSVWEKGLLGVKKNVFNKTIEKNQEKLSNQVNQSNIESINQQLSAEVKQGDIFLEILSPENNSVVNNSIIKIDGKTVASAEVFVNEQETKADTSGNFSLNYSLDEGENELIVVVNDNQGNYLEKILIITYQPQE